MPVGRTASTPSHPLAASVCPRCSGAREAGRRGSRRWSSAQGSRSGEGWHLGWAAANVGGGGGRRDGGTWPTAAVAEELILLSRDDKTVSLAAPLGEVAAATVTRRRGGSAAGKGAAEQEPGDGEAVSRRQERWGRC
ncbi:hypothetical protein ACP70R_039407 [Stipagrostis hirtigluma subsp. patula]